MSTCFKGLASSYNINILNFCNPKLELQYNESPIKN